MADATAEVARAFAQLTTSLIEMMTRLSVALIERMAELLRESARQGEQRARQQRARLARHRAADAAIWQRTADPQWWARATPQQIARAWRAVSTWHQFDAEAAGAKQAMAQRLRARGIDVAQDVSANPGDARWLQTALDLAMAEREERIAFATDLDTDAELADELMWDADELPRDLPSDQADQTAAPALADATPEAATPEAATPEAVGAETAGAETAGGQAADSKPTTQQKPPAAETPSQILWDADEKPLAPQETGNITTSAAARVNGVRLDLAVFDAAQADSGIATATSPAAGLSSEADRRARLLAAVAKQTAVATAPNDPRRLPQHEMTRMAGLLRSAWQHEPDRAQRVLADGAWPALASSMHRLDAQGKDVQGLLSRLDAATTESSIPAVTTDWALRTSAAGPAAAKRMKAGRQAHQTRLATARQQQPVAYLPAQERQHNVPRRRANEDSSTEAARLLTAAFPQSTRAALNQQHTGPATTSGRPGAARDRTARRERETTQTER